MPLDEYPRPQFKRDSYLSLNGYWDYEITKNEQIPGSFDKQILVPYSPETIIGGANHILQPDEYLYYRLVFNVPDDFIKEEVYLHFLAVDQICDVYLNDHLLGHHEGGFIPFKFEISKYLDIEDNVLILRVRDLTDTSYYSRGKQRLNHGGIWYTPQSGIFLPVFLESVPTLHVESVRYTPDIDSHELIINVKSKADKCLVTLENKELEISTNEDVHLKIENMHLWSTEDPYLYPITLKIGEDVISSYFAMRKFSIVTDKDGYKRLALNNEPIFMKGVLDQGYYKRGLLTPESYDDYIKDIDLAKNLGFNTIRKHIKIEIPRFYYECDKRGMIVWQDFVNGGTSYKPPIITWPLILHIQLKDNMYGLFGRRNKEGRKQVVEEFKETINYLYNSPCIALWTVFNEGWGQFDVSKVYQEIKDLDNTRIYDLTSGWHDQKEGDIRSYHFYFQKAKLNKKEKRMKIISEFGGLVLPIEGHLVEGDSVYTKYESKEDLISAYKAMIERDIINNIPNGLAASIYTQLTDVEEETNGFITFDREVTKFNTEDIKKINDLIHL